MKTVLSTVAVAGLFAAGAASAGGYVAPVVDEPVVVEPVVTAQVGNWEGGYVGATLGYAFGGKDTFGINDASTDPHTHYGDLGKFEVSGANAGLRAGYRWQSGQWVFGPEVSVEGGSIKDDFNVTVPAGGYGPLAGGDSYKFESKVRSLAALKLKTGYEVAPDTLITGSLGVASGKFEYKVTGPSSSATEKFSKSGYVVGLGVERKVTDSMSITGEIERNQFKKKDVYASGTDLYTTASPSFTNVKLGVNFNF